MAYTKHTWKERLGTGLNKFKDTITGTIMALVNQPDSVTQEGTPLRADWLNEMEQGIFDAHVTADAALPKTDKAADSAKLDGFEQSFDSVNGTIVRRSATNGSIQVGTIYENGTSLPLKYLGIEGKATDSEKLNGVVENGVAHTIVKRDSAGRAAMGEPTAGSHVATKNYVDNRIIYGTGAPPSTGTPGSIYIQY